MLNQKKVNEICHVIKNNGEEITIAKVHGLINDNGSFFSLVNKVLLFKNNPNLAKKLALNENKNTNTNKSENLQDIIDKVFNSYNDKFDNNIKILLQEKIQKFIKNKFSTKIKNIQEKFKKMRLLNSNIELRYYGLKIRYESLNRKFSNLKSKYYILHQKLRTISNIKNNQDIWYDKQYCNQKNKLLNIRDYRDQIQNLSSKYYCYAVYNAQNKQIILKAPLKHAIIRELKKGNSSMYLCANATFNYTNKFWILENFEYKTINLLIRNNFVISQELYIIFKNLEIFRK